MNASKACRTKSAWPGVLPSRSINLPQPALRLALPDDPQPEGRFPHSTRRQVDFFGQERGVYRRPRLLSGVGLISLASRRGRIAEEDEVTLAAQQLLVAVDDRLADPGRLRLHPE